MDNISLGSSRVKEFDGRLIKTYGGYPAVVQVPTFFHPWPPPFELSTDQLSFPTSPEMSWMPPTSISEFLGIPLSLLEYMVVSQKWWYTTIMGFPTKMIILGCFGGTTI